ncbi:MAG: cis-L-3-hydroxyproline dehydratase [Thermomicrobiales bacterium]|nr:cis-L-3-hydroxyproline dehydratase [Thermomicrobiales bacterium]
MGHVVAELSATAIVAGDASGEAITANEPLSFWGGLNPETGEIIDRRHPLSGRIVTGRVLVLPHGRGSCSASGVFLEAIRNGTAPAAVIVSRVDPIIGLGAILGEELYERTIPVSLISPQDRAVIADGDRVEISPDGRVLVSRNPASAE